MLDWILDEAEQHMGEVFSSPEPERRRRPRRRRSWSPSRFRTRRSNQSVDMSSVVSVDSSSVTSSSCSSSGSLDSEETRRRYLQQQARMLTQKILQRERSMLRRNKNTGYEADESIADYNSNVNSNVASSDTGASSGASYYFSTLNDSTSNGDCDVNRNKSILDDEDDSVSQRSEVQKPENKIDVERDIQIAVFHCNEMEEEIRKRNKLFSLKNKRKRRQLQEQHEEQGRVEIKLSPEELESQTQKAKQQEKKKLCIFTIIVVPLIICGMAGIGVFLALTWEPDSTSNESGTISGYPVQDDEGPTIRFSPEYDDNIFYTGDAYTGDAYTGDAYTGDAYTGTTDSSNSAVNKPLPISEQTAVPMVDDEVYRKHMEAYERWKLSGERDEDDDDDDDYSPQVDFDEYLDEISFQSERSRDGGGR